MMGLTDFPNEILLHIISHISLGSDLAKLTLVSHRFNSLTEPFLYRNIHFDAEPLEECEVGYLPTLKRTDRLIANLKARPELREYTTSFSLRVTNPLWYSTYPQMSIFRRMPQLRQISFDPPAAHGGFFPIECENLSDLRLDFSHVTDWLESGVPLEQVANSLWFPTLRKVQAEKIFFTAGFDHELYLVGRRRSCGRSRVVDMRFLDCIPCIDYNVMSAFIAAVRHLRCFVFEVNLTGESLTGPNNLVFNTEVNTDFKPALHAHHETIQVLALSTSDHAPDVVELSGSFIQWTALKRLAMPFPEDRARRTILHEMLPPQLEELQLERKVWMFLTHALVIEYGGVWGSDAELFGELAKKKQMCVPELKRLIWWLQYPSGQDFGDGSYRSSVSAVETRAVQTFKSVGVDFELVTTPFFRETPFGKRLCEW